METKMTARLAAFVMVGCLSVPQNPFQTEKRTATWAAFRIPPGELNGCNDIRIGPESIVRWHDGQDIQIKARFRVELSPFGKAPISKTRPADPKTIHFARRDKQILLGANGHLNADPDGGTWTEMYICIPRHFSVSYEPRLGWGTGNETTFTDEDRAFGFHLLEWQEPKYMGKAAKSPTVGR